MDEIELSKLFETAIARESEAHRFYKEAAGKVRDESVKAILEELAAEEKGHEETLWKLRYDPTLTLKVAAPEDWGVAETIDELPELTTDMKPADAFALAMKKEQQAVEGYRRLASWCTDPAMRDIYENLANMELGHKHRLERLFVDVGYPEVF